MSSISSTVSLIFQGVNNVTNTVNQIQGQVGALSSGIARVTAPLADFTTLAIKTEASIIALAAAMGAIAFRESVQFESSLLDLQKVLGDADPAAAEFVGTLEALAVQYGENGNALVASMANFKQSGFTAQESAALVKNALDLVIAGDIEAAQSSDLLVASLKGFGAEASEAGRLVDILNEVSNNYATSVEELAIGFARLSPVASAAGLTFEETAALLTPVIEVFRDGSESANGLKTILLRLTSDTKPVVEALATLGVSQRDANGELRLGRDILRDVQGAYQGLEETQKAAIAQQLAGTDQAARALIVFDNLNKTLAVNETATKAAGSAIKEVEIRLAAASTVINRSIEQYRQLAKTIGDEYRVQLTGVIDATGDLAEAIETSIKDGGFDTLFDALRPQLESLEGLIRTIAANFGEALAGVDFTRLVQSFERLGGAFGGLFGDLDLRTVEGLRDFLQGMADTLALLTDYVGGAVESFGPFVRQAGELLAQVRDLDPSLISLAGNIGGLATVAHNLSGPLALVVSGVTALGSAGPSISAFRSALSSLGGLIGTVGGLSTALGTGGLAGAVGLLSFTLTRESGLADLLNDILAPDLLYGDGASIGTFFADVTDALRGTRVELEYLPTPTQRALAEVTALRQEFEALAGPAADAPKRLVSSQEELARSGDRLAAVFAEQGLAFDRATGALVPLAQATEALADTNAAAGRSTQALVGYYTNADGKIVPLYRELSEVAKGGNEAAESLEQAAQRSEDFLIRMAEIASDERIRKFEIEASIQTAQFERDARVFESTTERIKANFESLGTTISSTGELLGSLVSEYTSAESRFDQIKLDRLIQQEMENREQALALQEKLTDAQVEQIRAYTHLLEVQARRLARGDGMIEIKVDGSEVDPALEQVWRVLVEKARARANEEGGAALLGLPITVAAP